MTATGVKFLDIQATMECRFTLKRVRDMIRTYSHVILYSNFCWWEKEVLPLTWWVLPKLKKNWNCSHRNMSGRFSVIRLNEAFYCLKFLLVECTVLWFATWVLSKWRKNWDVHVEIFDALRNLVPFVQFKKREKHPCRSVTFSNVKVTLLHGYFLRFLNCTNGTKPRKSSHMLNSHSRSMEPWESATIILDHELCVPVNFEF